MQFRLANRTVQTLGAGKLIGAFQGTVATNLVVLRRPYRLMNERSKRG